MLKVAPKGLQSASVHIRQNTASAMHEAAEVSGCPQIANRSCFGISLALERVCKTVDVRSARTDTQSTKCLGRTEVVLKHRYLPLVVPRMAEPR
jgi:hypothetical protein